MSTACRTHASESQFILSLVVDLLGTTPNLKHMGGTQQVARGKASTSDQVHVSQFPSCLQPAPRLALHACLSNRMCILVSLILCTVYASPPSSLPAARPTLPHPSPHCDTDTQTPEKNSVVHTTASMVAPMGGAQPLQPAPQQGLWMALYGVPHSNVVHSYKAMTEAGLRAWVEANPGRVEE